MYTDENLDIAIKKGIFTEPSVQAFRQQISLSKNAPNADEENFRLVGSFNDIFVVIACMLLLFSSLWVLNDISFALSFFIFSLLAWGLSEFFVAKRQMALPAIALLLSFVGGVFGFTQSFFVDISNISTSVAASTSTIAAYCHWLRFKVPITVSAGTAAGLGFLVATLFSLFPSWQDQWLVMLFIAGLLTFSFAMYWDSSDTSRVTRRSDVAFWLHLLSAPLIIHPVFSSQGILNGNESLIGLVIVLGLYIFMSFISIIIDRRAFMVSSLAYVLYALSTLIETFGGVSYSFALTGVLIGTVLLILSAFWHNVRARLVTILPNDIQKYIPTIKVLDKQDLAL